MVECHFIRLAVLLNMVSLLFKKYLILPNIGSFFPVPCRSLFILKTLPEFQQYVANLVPYVINWFNNYNNNLCPVFRYHFLFLLIIFAY